MKTHTLFRTCAAILSIALLAACGSGSTSDGGRSSDAVEVVTHTAVGGGTDVFTRQLTKTIYDAKISKTQWPVRNIPAGDAIGAMSYLVERAGNDQLLAVVTPTWLATPMTVAQSPVKVTQLTPISLVATEPQVIVAKAGGRFKSFAEFVAEAKAAPDSLVQAGGSSTANDGLTREVLQDSVGARWKFLSFEDTGSRITAVLRDDASILIGSASDVAEQVRAGQLAVIAVVGDQRLEIFPEVTTTKEQGIDSTKVPVQFRAVMGPPDMSTDAAGTYRDNITTMVESEEWESLVAESGLVTQNLQGEEFDSYLKEQTNIIGTLLGDLGLRKDK